MSERSRNGSIRTCREGSFRRAGELTAGADVPDSLATIVSRGGVVGSRLIDY
jgi:hypothetical protein